MVRKLIAASAAIAATFVMAGAAFAWPSNWDVAIVKNNKSEAYANTGENAQLAGQINKAKGSGEAEVEGNSVDQRMKTGDARARSSAVVVANTHLGCGCKGKGHVDVAYVGNNESYAGANTVYNAQGALQYNKAKSWRGGESEVEDNSVDQRMKTGDANAKSSAWVVVNTHVGGGP